MTTEQDRMTKARARRKRSKLPIFQKICKGLYVSHEFNMTICHEMVWSKEVGRKWELSYHTTSFVMEAPSRRTKKFESMQEARDYAKALAGGKA